MTNKVCTHFHYRLPTELPPEPKEYAGPFRLGPELTGQLGDSDHKVLVEDTLNKIQKIDDEFIYDDIAVSPKSAASTRNVG